jgi:hypothetical protein
MVPAGPSTAGVIPATVSALAREELMMMMLARLRNWTLGLLVVVGGTSAGALALAQRTGAPVDGGRPKEQAAANPMDRTVRSLLETRIATAREIRDRALDGIRTGSGGPGNFDQLAIWSRRLMEDRLRLAATRGERLDAIREHRDQMAVLEVWVKAYNEANQTPLSETLKGKYYRLEADQFLAEEGVDPAKERPRVDPLKELELPQPPPAPR